jgi:hypothetical protein
MPTILAEMANDAMSACRFTNPGCLNEAGLAAAPGVAEGGHMVNVDG